MVDVAFECGLCLFDVCVSRFQDLSGGAECPVSDGVLELEGEHIRAVRGTPIEECRGVELVGATAQYAVLQVKATIDLGHLRGMAKHVAGVGDGHRLGSPLGGDPLAHQQIPNQRLRARAEQIRHRKPRPDQNATALNQGRKTILVLWTQLKIVRKDAGLPVKVKILKVGIAFHQIQKIVNEFDEEQPEFLECPVPFTIPVRT